MDRTDKTGTCSNILRSLEYRYDLCEYVNDVGKVIRFITIKILNILILFKFVVSPSFWFLKNEK